VAQPLFGTLNIKLYSKKITTFASLAMYNNIYAWHDLWCLLHYSRTNWLTCFLLDCSQTGKLLTRAWNDMMTVPNQQQGLMAYCPPSMTSWPLPLLVPGPSGKFLFVSLCSRLFSPLKCKWPPMTLHTSSMKNVITIKGHEQHLSGLNLQLFKIRVNIFDCRMLIKTNFAYLPLLNTFFQAKHFLFKPNIYR